MSNGRPPYNPGDTKLASSWLNDVEKARRATQSGVDQGTGSLDYRITVLLTKKPDEEDTSLKVRRVRYNTRTPEECEGATCHYEFASGEFDAYPDFGKKIMDYDGDETLGTTIDDDSTFLKAYREAGTFRLEKPAGATIEVDDCVIVATYHTPGSTLIGETTVVHSTLTSTRLIIQRVHFDADLPTPNYVAKGSPMIVGTRANCPGDLYDDYADTRLSGANYVVFDSGKNNIGDVRAVYLEAKKKDGIWRVDQVPPLAIRTVPSGTAAACSTV